MKGINIFALTLLLLPAQVTFTAASDAPALAWQTPLSVCLRSTPAAGDDGVLYGTGSLGACDADSASGTVAIDPSSGDLLWGPVNPTPCTSVAGQVAVGKNAWIYGLADKRACGNGYLYALHASDGSLAWKQDSEDTGDASDEHSLLALDEALGRVYSGSASGIAYDMDSGGSIWRQGKNYSSEFQRPHSLAISPYGDIYYSIGNGTGGSGIDVFDSAGTLLWQIPFEEAKAYSILGVTSQSHLLVGTDDADSYISAYDQTGKLLWRCNKHLRRFVEDVNGYYYFTSPVLPDVTSLFSDGTPRWNITLPDATWANVSFIDEEGTLYAIADNGLHAVNGETGEILWTFQTDGDLLPDVDAVLAPDGAIVLYDSNATLYRLETHLSYANSSWPIAKYADQRHSMKGRAIHSPPTIDQDISGISALLGSSETSSSSITVNRAGDNESAAVSSSTDPAKRMSVDGILNLRAIPATGFGITDSSVFTDDGNSIGLRSDFNGDTVDDPLLFNSASGAAVIWKMDSSTTIDSIPVTAIEESNWKFVGTGDFNGDNSDDILLYNEITFQVVAWIMVNSEIQQSKVLTTLNNSNYHYFEVRAIGDFDADGDDDLFVYNPLDNTDSILVIENAAIVSTAHIWRKDFNSWTVIGAGDFNADGYDDILMRYDNTGAIAMWIMQNNQPIGSYGLGTLSDIEWDIFGIGDYNSDATDEIFLYHNQNKQVVAWQIDGSSLGFSLGIADLSGTDWSPITVGDFNGDTRDDILVWNETTQTAAAWLLDGPAISQSVGLGTLSSEWAIVSLQRRNRFQFNSDFDGDGKADILLTDTDSGDVSILFSDLNTTFHPITNLLGTGWQILYKGDFDADHSTEVVLQNDNSGTVALWRMDGFQIVNSAGITTIGDACWSIAAAADFDGNGTTDLLLEHAGTRQRIIWSMNGSSIELASSVPYAGTDWLLVETGDFNGDDKADLLLEKSTTHELVIWFMSGADVIGGGGLATISNLNWEIKGTGDFDGDGRSDILLRNHQTSELAFWRIIDNTLIYSAGVDERYFSSLDDTWSIAQINDITGDGRDDIIWRKTDSELRITVWAMMCNRPTRYESGNFATLANTNLEIVK